MIEKIVILILLLINIIINKLLICSVLFILKGPTGGPCDVFFVLVSILLCFLSTTDLTSSSCSYYLLFF